MLLFLCRESSACRQRDNILCFLSCFGISGDSAANFTQVEQNILVCIRRLHICISHLLFAFISISIPRIDISDEIQTVQHRPNKALHPTAYSLPSLVPRFGFRRRVSLVVVPSRAAWLRVILNIVKTMRAHLKNMQDAIRKSKHELIFRSAAVLAVTLMTADLASKT